nr:VCBS repeat-containing protein [Nannocystis sp.]
MNKRIDPLGFPILGLITFAACGPGAPQDSGTEGTSAGTESTSAGPTSDPTSDPTDPTRPTTTEPMPECESYDDCDHLYCGYCSSEGVCEESVGCCGGYGAQIPASKWRCSPGYDCYSDEECGFGYACISGECGESPAIPLPGCDPPDGFGSEWNLSNAPSAFILADLDGDTDLDFAAALPASGMIEIGFNDGNGNFNLAGAFVNFAEGPTGELALAAGDLDNDGDIDLAVTRREANGVLHLLFNDGAVFTVGEPRPTAPFPVQVFISDINGDGLPDVATVSEAEPRLGIQLGDGNGQFSPEQPGTVVPIETRAWVGDFSLDGVPDLLAPIPSDAGGIFVAFVGGKGPFLEPLRQFNAPEAASMAVLGADLDFQMLTDVVAVHAHEGAGMAQVWAGTELNQWSNGRQRYITTRPLLGGALAEFDAVPGPDLISATDQSNFVVLAGDGKGGFTCEHIFDIVGPSSPALIAVGDVDNDGRNDIVAGGSGSLTVSITHLF